MNSERVEFICNTQFVGYGEIDAFALTAVAQGRIVDLDFGFHECPQWRERIIYGKGAGLERRNRMASGRAGTPVRADWNWTEGGCEEFLNDRRARSARPTARNYATRYGAMKTVPDAIQADLPQLTAARPLEPFAGRRPGGGI